MLDRGRPLAEAALEAAPAGSPLLAATGIAGEIEVALDVDGERASARVAVVPAAADLAARAAAFEGRARDGDLEGAAAEAEAALEAHPRSDWAARRAVELCEEAARAASAAAEPARKAEARQRWRLRARRAEERWLALRVELATLFPAEPRAHVLLGAAYQVSGRLVESEAAYRRALARAPDDPEATAWLADVLARRGETDAARALAARVVARHPTWFHGHYLQGEVLLRAQDARGAIQAFGRALAIDPRQAEWLQAKIAYAANLGGPNAVAIAEAERRVKAVPDDRAGRRALADALFKGMAWERAVEEYRGILEPDGRRPPPDPLPEGQGNPRAGAGFRLGLALELLGDLDGAATTYAAGDRDAEADRACRRRLARLELFRAEGREPPGPPLPSARVPLEDADGHAKAAREEIRRLEDLRPRMAAALADLPPLADGDVAADDLDALRRLVSFAVGPGLGPEAGRGLDLIERTVRRREEPLDIDGDPDEWDPEADLVATDPAADVAGRAPAEADLVEASARIEGDRLAVAWRARAPAEPSAEVWYFATLFGDGGEGEPWFELGIGGEDGAQALLIEHRGGKRVERRLADVRGAEWASDTVLEAAIPLALLAPLRRMKCEVFTWAPAPGILDRAETGAPGPVRLDPGYDARLLALYHLAGDARLGPDDPVAVALALATADLFAYGDARLHRAVRDDNRRMLDLAAAIGAWQRRSGLPPLAAQPLAALLFWANRGVLGRADGVHAYRRRFVDPVALEAAFRFATGPRGFRVATPNPTPESLVSAVEGHLAGGEHWQYTSSLTVAAGVRAQAGDDVSFSDDERRELEKFVRPAFVDGRRVTTDGTFPPDLQLDYLAAADVIVGHCGNLAQTTIEVARALGIPATYVQGLEEDLKAWQNNHAFAIYWDGAARGWRSFQGARYQGPRPVDLYAYLPPRAASPPDGAGVHYGHVRLTYDQVGRSFREGFPGAAFEGWLLGPARAPGRPRKR